MNTLQIIFGLIAVYLFIGVLFATWFHQLKPDGEQAPIGWSELVLKWPPVALVAFIGITLVHSFRQTDTIEVKDRQ